MKTFDKICKPFEVERSVLFSRSIHFGRKLLAISLYIAVRSAMTVTCLPIDIRWILGYCNYDQDGVSINLVT